MTFSIPIPKSPLVDKQGIINRDWFVFLSNLLTAVGNGAVGNSNEVLHGGSLGYSQVVLSQDVIGTLPITNGGTGATTSTGALSNFGLSVPVTPSQGGTGITSPGASGNLLTSNGTIWASMSPSGAVAASQSDQETGTSTSVYVSPGVQQFHSSSPKSWVCFNGTGVVAIRASYNVSSITDNGTGDYTVNFTTSFSSANYGFMFGGNQRTSDTFIDVPVAVEAGIAAGSCQVRTYTTTGVLGDWPFVSCAFLGDQ